MLPRHKRHGGLRWAALVAVLVLPMSTLTADDPDTGRAQSVEPEATLRKLGEQYVAAFNQHDAQAIANFWSPNAVYINRLSGAQVTGREAIAAQFKALFASQPEAKLQVRVDSIQLVSPNVAVEKGVSTLVATTPLQVPYSAVYVQVDGKWLLDRVTDSPQEVKPSHYGKLKPLEWMIGSWVDQDENVTVEAECKWTKNKNFIHRTFKIEVNGEVQISGMQLIGWDAQEKRIRSWTFDSDGGFAQARWSNQGRDWYAVRKGKTAEGQVMSGVHVFKWGDENAYTFQAVQRALDGQILPDSAAVTVVRE